MNIDEAITLQALIAETYMYLDVSIKPVEQGNTYACYVEQRKYYLWSEEDWYQMQESQRERLYPYTEPGRLALATRIRETRARNKKRAAQVSIP
jgi:hypothetical protein